MNADERKAVKRKILLWLEWPEKCFRVDARSLAHLRALVPAGTVLVRARTERAFLRELPTATHALVWSFKAEWFARARALRVLATPAAGREFVPESGPEGVKIHFGTFHGPIMSETVLAFVSAWAHGFFRPELRTDAWPRTALSDKCRTLARTRAVIFGFGHIGRAIGRKLAMNGVQVTGVTRHGLFTLNGDEGVAVTGRVTADGDEGVAVTGRVTADGDEGVAVTGRVTADGDEGVAVTGEPTPQRVRSVLRTADWLILALPSTTGTDKIVNARLLASLPSRCVLVNVGRGNAIDEKALYESLRARRLAGAYLDVRCHEPTATVLEADGYEKRLAKLDNCVLMPHASAFDQDYMIRCFDELKKEGLLK